MALGRRRTATRIAKRFRAGIPCYLLALPAILYTFCFSYLTLPYIVIAFQKYNVRKGLMGSTWIGLRNFQSFFLSTRWISVTTNTLVINFFSIIIGAAFAVLMAVLLSEARSRRFVKVNQSMYLFPNFLSWIVVSYMVYAFFSTEFGVVNQTLRRLGAEPVNWYLTPRPWTAILVALRIWKGAGMQIVIFLATITGMDAEIYEAALVDGANRFQQAMRITLPMLLPTVMITTLLALGKIFYGDFGMIYSIIRDNSMLFDTADVIDTYVFRLLRKTGDPGQSMAIGLYQSFMGFLLVYLSNLVVRKHFSEGALF
ncbi:MAG: sugar ABC transporter permease [Clostridiales bacterium]|nr:sugar ABC transporter permease [Clostridiales bacterium]